MLLQRLMTMKLLTLAMITSLAGCASSAGEEIAGTQAALETVSPTASGSSDSPAVCGNGEVEEGEDCDNEAGNGLVGNGCSRNCRFAADPYMPCGESAGGAECSDGAPRCQRAHYGESDEFICGECDNTQNENADEYCIPIYGPPVGNAHWGCCEDGACM